jgi:putative hydrolase of the HAD superfamily
MTKIRAVLFDYGMVLSGAPDATQRRRMEALLHADADTFNAAYWRSRDAYDRGTLSGTKYWKGVAEHLGQPLDADTLAELIDADTALWASPNEPMIDFAFALQNAGIRTGILSNLGDEMELGLCSRLPWLQDFAHRTFSHRLGIAKPDAAIYEHAAAGMGVPANQILFIDDREENITAARTAGMHAIHYTSHDAFIGAMSDVEFPQGVPTLEQLLFQK